MKPRVSIAIGILSLVGVSAPAAADTFVNPLDTVPKPNVVVGFDHSVTMGIQRDCSACHAPGNPNTRLNVAKQDILQTLPLFKDYFVFGGFTYKGCNYAEITSRYLPTPSNPDTSYNQVYNMISTLQHCGSRENSLPNGGSAWTNCITPSTGCADDLPIVQTILGGTPPGIALTTPTVLTSSACDNPISPVPSYSVQAALISKFGSGAFNWPRWDPTSLDAATVQAELCDPVENLLQQIQTELGQCHLNPTNVWDMSFLGNPSWCDSAVIANTACTAWPFRNTCVCDQTVTGPGGETCFTAGMVSSECGVPFVFKARQQVAVCELYDPQPGRFGDFYQNQPDNHVNGSLPNYCRENVGMIFTDGYMGDTAGVAAEAANAIPTYLSVSGLSNLFVFRIADPVPRLLPFIAAGDVMQDELAGPSGLTAALLATDAAAMQSSFAQVLSRVFKGVYTGASLTTDEFQTRAFVNSFTVPGYSATGPVSDTYIGWPQRLSAYAIDPTTGAIGTSPLWETDWSSVVGATSCGPSNPSIPGFDVSMLGPGGSFRNGVPRSVTIPANSIDRNGDGVVDTHPPLTWGRSYGFASTEPVVVEAPREAPGGGQSVSFAAHQMATRTRNRAVYIQSDGYVLGYNAGTYTNSTTVFGAQKASFQYVEDASTGAEILRYMPSWLNDPNADYKYGLNNLVQQPILEGDLEAREVFDGRDWRTVLVGSAGAHGRGFFSLDITDPCSISLLGEWTLPNAVDRASNEPKIYTVPTPSGPRPAIIVTGGLNGTSSIIAYAAVPATTSGEVYYQGVLNATAGASYSVTPVCVDARGEGFVTHCYSLRSDGYLSRIQVTPTGFVNETDITPNVGPTLPIGGSRVYSTEPVAYFSSDGNVNLVFGSGDFKNLTGPTVQNYVFKVTDAGIRKKVVPNTRADVSRTCYPAGGTGPTDGVFPLAAGERMISSPVVVGGGVFWTAYTSTNNGCVAGQGNLYAMNFDTCYDILTPTPTTNRPAAKPIGNGIPLSPTINRRANVAYTQSTAGPAASEIGNVNAALRGGRNPIVKRLYWRPFMDIR